MFTQFFTGGNILDPYFRLESGDDVIMPSCHVLSVFVYIGDDISNFDNVNRQVIKYALKPYIIEMYFDLETHFFEK